MIGTIRNTVRNTVINTVKLGANVNLSPEYKLVYDAMTVKPNVVDAHIQDSLMRYLVDNGYYAKAELIDIFATHEGGALVNWASPGTFNPETVNDPPFEAYGGYTGVVTGSKYINLKFNPTQNGNKISQDNICCIAGVLTDTPDDLYDFGGKSGTTYLLLQSMSTQFQAFTNSANTAVTHIAGTKRHIGFTRNASTNVDALSNIYTQLKTVSSNGTVDVDLYACAYNNAGTPKVSNRQVAYVMIFSALTEIEMRDIVGAMEDYLSYYSKRIVPYINGYPVNNTKQEIICPTFVENNNEVVHPSVIDCQTQWNGYRYWMANTPYPLKNSNYELPEVYCSNDAVNWIVPPGATNPLFAYDGTHKYSDPDLFFENNKMYLFFRDLSTGISMTNVIESSDGITWSTKKTVLNIDGDFVLTHSVVKIGLKYYMYALSSVPEINTISRYSADSIDGVYGDKENITFPFFLVNHLSVYVLSGIIYLALGNNANRGIFLGKSSDGINFIMDSVYNPIIYKTKEFEERNPNAKYYRPDICEINEELYIYYSMNVYSTAEEGSYMGRQKIKLI